MDKKTEEELNSLRRTFEQRAAARTKSFYLSGNKNEVNTALAYNNYVAFHNSIPGNPHIMLCKKKFRRT